MTGELDGLTAIDRLRLYATDPDTFSFDIDDAIAAVEKYEEVERRADLVEQMAAALRDAKHWASTRCPVREEKPDPCPLCGATVDGKDLDGVCKSVEAIFPRALLAQLSAVLQAYEAAQ